MISKTSAYVLLSALYLTFGLNCPDPVVSAATKIMPLVLLSALCFRNRTVLSALVFSMVGDAVSEFMLLGQFRMPLQIFFFAVAQVFYIIEFSKYRRAGTGCRGAVLSVLPFMMGVYAAIELTSLVSACLQDRKLKAFCVVGMGFFLFSDALILVRFVTGGFPYSGYAVMSTYYAAQFLINFPLVCDETDA